jgi:hypothetical protein
MSHRAAAMSTGIDVALTLVPIHGVRELGKVGRPAAIRNAIPLKRAASSAARHARSVYSASVILRSAWRYRRAATYYRAAWHPANGVYSYDSSR